MLAHSFLLTNGHDACMLVVQAPSSSTNPLRLTQVAISNEVQHSLLAVSFATSPEELLSLNVAGFIYVKEVDTSKGTLSYLAPCPGSVARQVRAYGKLQNLS